MSTTDNTKPTDSENQMPRVLGFAYLTSVLLLRLHRPEEFTNSDEFTPLQVSLALAGMQLQSFKAGFTNEEIMTGTFLAQQMYQMHDRGEVHLIKDSALTMDIEERITALVGTAAKVYADVFPEMLKELVDESLSVLFKQEPALNA